LEVIGIMFSLRLGSIWQYNAKSGQIGLKV